EQQCRNSGLSRHRHRAFSAIGREGDDGRGVTLETEPVGTCEIDARHLPRKRRKRRIVCKGKAFCRRNCRHLDGKGKPWLGEKAAREHEGQRDRSKREANADRKNQERRAGVIASEAADQPSRLLPPPHSSDRTAACRAMENFCALPSALPTMRSGERE